MLAPLGYHVVMAFDECKGAGFGESDKPEFWVTSARRSVRAHTSLSPAPSRHRRRRVRSGHRRRRPTTDRPGHASTTTRPTTPRSSSTRTATTSRRSATAPSDASWSPTLTAFPSISVPHCACGGAEGATKGSRTARYLGVVRLGGRRRALARRHAPPPPTHVGGLYPGGHTSSPDERLLWTTTDDAAERVMDEIEDGLAEGHVVQPVGAFYSGAQRRVVTTERRGVRLSGRPGRPLSTPCAARRWTPTSSSTSCRADPVRSAAWNAYALQTYGDELLLATRREFVASDTAEMAGRIFSQAYTWLERALQPGEDLHALRVEAMHDELPRWLTATPRHKSSGCARRSTPFAPGSRPSLGGTQPLRRACSKTSPESTAGSRTCRCSGSSGRLPSCGAVPATRSPSVSTRRTKLGQEVAALA